MTSGFLRSSAELIKNTSTVSPTTLPTVKDALDNLGGRAPTSLPVPIAEGGTGATTVIGALVALGFVGVTVPFAGTTAPSGWLLCFGQNVSRTTYAALMAVIRRSATITVTIASPAVVTWTAHGLNVGDPVVFRTTGALPTGITAGTVYFVIAAGLTADAFQFSATVGGAAVNTSGSQSGVHTGVSAPYGDGDGSTTFGIPDLRGRVVAGQDDMGGTSANRLTGVTGSVDGDVLGGVGGLETHTLTTAQMPAHTHNVGRSDILAAAGAALGIIGAVNTPSSSTGGDGAHNNVQPTIILNYMIFAGA